MGEVAAGPVSPPPEKRSALRDTRDSLVSVFSNPNLRRVQLAFVGSAVGDWAYATAVTVWAYGVGGATAVGIWAAVRLGLMAVTAPLGAAVADRVSRKKVMVVADLVRAVLVVAAAACLFLDAPAAAVFVLATLTGLLGTPFRVAQRALLPSLARRPEELTASNGASSTIESLAFFVGPALGALLIAVTDVSVVFVLNALTFVWSMVMVLGIRVPGDGGPAEAALETEMGAEVDAAAGDAAGADVVGADAAGVDVAGVDVAGVDVASADVVGADPDGGAVVPVTEPTEEKEGFVREVLAGFRVIGSDRNLLTVTVLVCAQTVVAGASAVFAVVMAVDILGLGAHGVGYLDSVLGAGAIVGGLLAISRATRHRLAQDLTAGVVLWSLPLLLVAIWPSPATAFAAMALLGFANPLVDVNMDTIFMRLAPDAVMARVFGSLEAALIGTMALGSLAMPFLLGWFDLRISLAVIGVSVTAVALAGLPTMRRLDALLAAPPGLDLLRSIPMFAPLSPGTMDGLAARLNRLEVPAGEVVVREGEASDRFYVIESGVVEVTRQGAVLRQEVAGDFFGEIGLLRDVPRTATVTAVSDTVLLVLDRDDFLGAVTGHREANVAAEAIVARRLTV